MRRDQWAGWAAGVAVAATGLAACWGFAVRPSAWPRWLLTAAMLPAAWAYVEVAQVRGRDESVGRAIMTVIRYSLAWGGLMISLRLALRLALYSGLLHPAWEPIGHQVLGLVLAAGMILFGNTLPTLRSPWPYPHQPFAWQQVHRFVGWVFVLGGLAIAGAWLTMPGPSAAHVSTMVMAATVALALGRKFASVLSSSDGQLAP